MANVYAVKSGNWSDVTVWNTGALPTSADDVWANTFTVVIDTSTTVLSLNNGATTGITAGGTFSLTSASNNVTLTATVGLRNNNGSTRIITSTLPLNNSATLNLNITADGGAGTNGKLIHSGAGTLNINGNLYSWYYVGCVYCSAGTLNVVGNAYEVGSNANIFNQSGTSVINMTGTYFGAGGNAGGFPLINFNLTGSPAVQNNGSYGLPITGGTATITGDINGGTGQPALTIASGATVTVTGKITGGTVASVSNNGTLIHNGICQATQNGPAIGLGAVGQVTILTGPLLSTDASFTGASASGVNPCIALRWFPADTALSTFEYRMRGQTLSGSPSIRPARQLFLTDAYAATYPATSNVRSSTIYGPGNIYTGTLAVPPPGSVALGVPVDNTTGTAALTADQIRAAMGLASANLDAQLDALPTAAEIAESVWTYSTRLLSSVSAIVSGVWAATTRTVTGGTIDSVASLNASARTEIATAVRTELTTELNRIDVATSTRLAPSGTLARVTLTDTTTAVTDTAAIADAVRTELTPELNRVINTSTTQEVADIVEGALQTPQ